MKRALCVNSFEDISALIKGESPTIDSCFVDRTICEDPNNKFLQVIPYVTFYTVLPAEGKIKFIQYLRAAEGNEERLVSKSSIGFGGHIDQLTDIKSSTAYTAEDTTEHFTMSKEDLVETTFAAAKRELAEELNVDILNVLGVSLDFENTAFFMGDPREEVNLVHVGLCIPVKLTEEQLNLFMQSVKVNPAEIQAVDRMTANIRHVVEEMDVTVTLNKIMNELRSKHGMEDWSCRVFDFISRREIHDILKNVNYDDLYRVAKERADAATIQAALVPPPPAEVVVPAETAAPVEASQALTQALEGEVIPAADTVQHVSV